MLSRLRWQHLKSKLTYSILTLAAFLFFSLSLSGFSPDLQKVFKLSVQLRVGLRSASADRRKISPTSVVERRQEEGNYTNTAAYCKTRRRTVVCKPPTPRPTAIVCSVWVDLSRLWSWCEFAPRPFVAPVTPTRRDHTGWRETSRRLSFVCRFLLRNIPHRISCLQHIVQPKPKPSVRCRHTHGGREDFTNLHLIIIASFTLSDVKWARISK